MKRVISIAAVLASLAVAGQASAANYKVFLGEQSRPPAGTPKGATLDVFLPGSITINAGDSVTFSSASFHTASYGGTFPPTLIPDPAHGKYAPVADAAGNNFWFTGKSKYIYNVPAFAPYGPKSITPGVKASSGALSPAGPKAKPATATFTFPKPGTYKLFCAVHPGMKGTVVVKPAGTAVPKSPAQVTAQALADTAAGWAKTRQAAAAAKPAANEVYMGAGGGTGPNLIAYFPSRLTVKAGTTVTFVNKGPIEPHNVTFGPKKYILGLQKKTDLFPTGPSGPNEAAGIVPYGSDPSYKYDGTNHGNGFLATVITGSSKLGTKPISSKVTFTKPGTYKYFCWVHGPEMAGTIVVTS